MIKIARVLLATAVLGLGLAIAVHADGGVIQGQVSNGTAGEHPPLAGLNVQLYLFTGNTLKEKRTTNTSATGVYRFDGLPTGGAWSAVTTVQYAGVDYASQTLDLAASSELTGDITVYETTNNDSALRVESSHVIIEAGKDQLEVTEQLILANTGDRTYIGSEEVIPNRRATARVALPAGAADVFFDPQDTAAMIRTGQGFVDTRPIVPGRQDYLFSFILPVDSSLYTLAVPLPYATDALDLLVNAPGAEVNAPTMERLGTREASGVTYQYLAARNLNKGDELQVRFSGLGRGDTGQEATAAQSSVPAAEIVQRPWWYRFGPLLLLPALLTPVAIRLRRKAEEQIEQDNNVELRRLLLARLADLDDRYETGEVEAEAYRQDRVGLMAQLVHLSLGETMKEGEHRVEASAPKNARRANARPRKEVRARGRTAERRPKAG